MPKQWRVRWYHRVKWRLQAIGWPSYPCEQCVGQEPQQGCYCAYHGAVSPGGPGPGRLLVAYRRVWGFLFGDPWDWSQARRRGLFALIRETFVWLLMAWDLERRPPWRRVSHERQKQSW